MSRSQPISRGTSKESMQHDLQLIAGCIFNLVAAFGSEFKARSATAFFQMWQECLMDGIMPATSVSLDKSRSFLLGHCWWNGRGLSLFPSPSPSLSSSNQHHLQTMVSLHPGVLMGHMCDAGSDGMRLDELVQHAQQGTIQGVTLSQQEVMRALTQNAQAFELRSSKWHLRPAATMN